MQLNGLKGIFLHDTNWRTKNTGPLNVIDNTIFMAIRYRKVKSDDGQCHVHIKGCKDTRILHSSIYDQWINVVKEALNALSAGRPSLAS